MTSHMSKFCKEIGGSVIFQATRDVFSHDLFADHNSRVNLLVKKWELQIKGGYNYRA